MPKGIEKLKTYWDDNPMQLIIIGSFAATAAAKLINSLTSAKNARSWKKEVNRRTKMSRR